MFNNKLGDLDDFLAPSLECIKPLMPVKKPGDGEKLDVGEWKIDSNIEKPRPDLIKATGENKVAAVTLQDCLACSGCVTSAETVLI